MFLEDPQRAERNHKHSDIGENVVGRVPPRGGIPIPEPTARPMGSSDLQRTGPRAADGRMGRKELKRGVRRRETPPL